MLMAADWDDLKPQPKPAACVGDDLSRLSIAELEARVAAFTAEIERVAAEIAVKKSRQSAADSLFKR
jgi:uncharacterized small protein (DUF1192 family)